MELTGKDPKRWLSLIAMIVVLFIMQFSCLITAGVATMIMPELGLSPAQFGMLCNMPFLAGVLFGILTGNLGDRYGIKKMMTIGIIIFAIGAFWRAFSHDFIMLMISSLCMGFGVAVLNANSTKGIRLWFEGPSMAPAMGLYVCGASVGAGIAISVGPYFATFSDAFMLCGWLGVAAVAVWILLYRTHPSEKDASQSERVGMSAFKSILKNKYVWIVSFMIFFVFGCSTTFQTYISAAFAIKTANDMAAVSVLSMISAVAVAVGSIFMPMLITRFKRFRPVMAVIFLCTAVTAALCYLLPFGVWTYVFMAIFGIFLGTCLAMGKAVPALLPGINVANLGAVGGLHSALQNVGAWCIAGYIIAPICQSFFAQALYPAIYIGAAICAILGAITVLLLPRDLPTAHRPE